MPAPDTPDFPQIAPSGVDGLVVRFASRFTAGANAAALALRAAIDTADWPGVTETATGLVSTLIRFDPLTTPLAPLTARLQDLLSSRDWTLAPLPPSRRLIVPACFDPALAPQIDEATRAAGLPNRQAAIDSLCGQDLSVLTIGFAPGQPYIGALPDCWNLPRQRDLTPRVPVGALTLAIRQLVLFAVESQTGWRHVGQTALRLFQPDTATPFLLRPGDRLRFRPVTPEALAPLWADPMGGARIEGCA